MNTSRSKIYDPLISKRFCSLRGLQIFFERSLDYKGIDLDEKERKKIKAFARNNSVKKQNLNRGTLNFY